MKIPMPRGWLCPYKLLVKKAPGAPQIMQVINTAADRAGELDSKTLLLKVSHALVTGEIILAVTGKDGSSRLASPSQC